MYMRYCFIANKANISTAIYQYVVQLKISLKYSKKSNETLLNKIKIIYYILHDLFVYMCLCKKP